MTSETVQMLREMSLKSTKKPGTKSAPNGLYVDWYYPNQDKTVAPSDICLTAWWELPVLFVLWIAVSSNLIEGQMHIRTPKTPSSWNLYTRNRPTKIHHNSQRTNSDSTIPPLQSNIRKSSRRTTLTITKHDTTTINTQARAQKSTQPSTFRRSDPRFPFWDAWYISYPNLLEYSISSLILTVWECWNFSQ